MSDQQSNLYQQPPQPSQLSGQPSLQNKLWPINWKHNKILKIIGLICLTAMFISLISFITISLYEYQMEKSEKQCQESKSCIYLRHLPIGEIIMDLLGWLQYFTSFISFIAALLYIPIALIRIKKLDTIDKIFSLLSLFALTMFVFFSPFIVY